MVHSAVSQSDSQALKFEVHWSAEEFMIEETQLNSPGIQHCLSDFWSQKPINRRTNQETLDGILRRTNNSLFPEGNQIGDDERTTPVDGTTSHAMTMAHVAGSETTCLWKTFIFFLLLRILREKVSRKALQMQESNLLFTIPDPEMTKFSCSQ